MSGTTASRRPVAFHAPLKAPGHPVPSGDRRMARLMMRALEVGGFAPEVASQLRTFDRTGDTTLQTELTGKAARETDALITRWGKLSTALRPRLWFTYHCHYKAPDLIGPAVSRALGIPYVVAEGSRTSKHREGPWARWNAACDHALDHANLLFAMTAHDRFALERDVLPGQTLADLPPFLDLTDWPIVRLARGNEPLRLLTVAMMRADVKRSSYLLLAEALQHVGTLDWTLDIAGDGDARSEIEAAFRPLGDRVTFHGLIEDRKALLALHAQADLMVWPAIGEAYGVALMEAQAAGLPVLAGHGQGVASILADGETGIMTNGMNPSDFGAAILNASDRIRHGAFASLAAFDAYRARHGLEGAADILRRELSALLEPA